jgi:phage terminase large subunit
MDQVITIPYRPREHQLAIHDAVDSHRFAVAVCHRRFGKTVAAINQIIKAAVLCGRDNPRYAVVCPTYTQAKRVAWDYVTQYTQPLDPKVNISELRVDFMGRRISLYMEQTISDSLRGIYLDGVVLDEVGDMNPKIWTEILRPCSCGSVCGWALFIGTPKGQNHFKELRDRAETEADWALLEFKASETGILPQAELEAARKEMGDDKYFQEFEC